MATKHHVVTGEQYRIVDRRMREIKRQLDQDGGSPLDPNWVACELQRIVEGSSFIADWQKFYQDIFSRKFDFSCVLVPEAAANFSWFVCVPSDLMTEEAFSGGKKQFPIWKSTNKPLDESLDLSFGRDARKDPYIVRFRPNIEADADLKELSAEDIAARGLDTATLKERLLLGRFLYWKEEIILDKEVITLCSGSRDRDGCVPGVSWDDDEVDVRWYSPRHAIGHLRSRQAVS